MKMVDESNICGVPKDDIENYAMMIHALDRGADAITGETKMFLGKYGKDVKEIQTSMRKHFDGCFLCSSYYKEFSEDLAFIGDFFMERQTEKGRELSKKMRKRSREWGIEHSAYENPKNLHEYLFKRASSFVKDKTLELNLEFERHIKEKFE